MLASIKPTDLKIYKRYSTDVKIKKCNSCTSLHKPLHDYAFLTLKFVLHTEFL